MSAVDGSNPVSGAFRYSEDVMDTTVTNTQPPTDAAGTTAAAAGAPSQADATTTTTTERTFTQADIDRIVKERLAEEKRRQDAAIAKARETAEEQNKLKLGETQSVLEARAARIAELEAQTAAAEARAAALETTLTDQLAGRIKALPESIRALRPDGDVTAVTAWLDKAEKAAAELQQAAKPPVPGTPTGPRGSGAAPTTPLTTAIQAKRNSGNYGI